MNDARPVSTAADACALADKLIAQFPPGTPFDTRELIARHPELIDHRSALIDLAYEEFGRYDDLGIAVEPGEFAARFPTIAWSLLHLIEAHDMFAGGPATAMPPKESRWPVPGSAWLGFEVLEELGRGAFSRVYLAREEALGRRLVVVKATPLGPQEAQTLGRLQHPHVVPVHSVLRDERLELTAVCMPFLSRVSLFDLMDAMYSARQPPQGAAALLELVRGINSASSESPAIAVDAPWPGRWRFTDAVLQIGRQVAQALEHAHRQGVLHRDVKPSNIIITNSGRALLLDFNLAVSDEDSTPITGGTVPYMAPEQLRPRADAQAAGVEVLDERTDIFSLGVTLYELAYGRPPFGHLPALRSRDRACAELLEKQRQGAIIPTGGPASVDRRVGEIIVRCLAFDPLQRPQSMGELAALFAAQMATPKRARRWLRTHRRQARFSAALVCGLGLAAAGWQWTREPFSIREWRQGEAAYEQNEYATAVGHLSVALKEDPRLAEARFLRGCAHFRQKEYVAAYADLEPLSREVPDGRATAALAHVVAVLQGDFGQAGALYRKALEEGCRLPVIYNNLGYCLSEKGNLAEAIESLKTAQLLNSEMTAVLHNLAHIEIRLSVRKGHVPDPAPIEEALRHGPENAELYSVAACFYAICSRVRADQTLQKKNVDRVFEYLERALPLGLNQQQIDRAGQLNAKLKTDARWVSLRPQPALPVANPVALMPDPLDQLRRHQTRSAPVLAGRQ